MYCSCKSDGAAYNDDAWRPKRVSRDSTCLDPTAVWPLWTAHHYSFFFFFLLKKPPSLTASITQFGTVFAALYFEKVLARNATEAKTGRLKPAAQGGPHASNWTLRRFSSCHSAARDLLRVRFTRNFASLAAATCRCGLAL
jgi:hypothetical protein